MQSLTIDKSCAGQRLDKFLLKYLNQAPKSFVYKMLRKKNIKLNGKKAEGSEMLSPGDEICLYLADDTIAGFRSALHIKAQRTVPDIIYEDENIIAANKPAGMPVQGGTDDAAENLNDILLYYLKQKGALTDIFKPGVANRLDRNTGGIVVMGKNLAAAQALAEAFRSGGADKRYIAAVCGCVETGGEISGWHSKDSQNKVTITAGERDGAVPVKTMYTPIFTGEKYSILSVKLITGKSHQIRESLRLKGHPIIGDPKYGNADENIFFKKKFGLSHQLLYAVSLEFTDKSGIFENIGKITCVPDKQAENVLEYIKTRGR